MSNSEAGKSNPFTLRPIKKPGFLVGQEKFIADLFDRMNRNPVYLIGGRRTGKTSILHCLKETYQSENNLFLYWDMLATGKKGLNKLLEIMYESGYGEFKDIYAFFKKYENKKIFLLIDEIEILLDADYLSTKDFHKLRSLIIQYDNFSILIASPIEKDEAKYQNESGSEFLNVFSTVNMEYPAVKGVDEFYREFLSKKGFADGAECEIAKECFYSKILSSSDENLHASGFEFIEKRIGLNPYYLQALGEKIWSDIPGQLDNLNEAFEEIKSSHIAVEINKLSKYLNREDIIALIYFTNSTIKPKNKTLKSWFLVRHNEINGHLVTDCIFELLQSKFNESYQDFSSNEIPYRKIIKLYGDKEFSILVASKKNKFLEMYILGILEINDNKVSIAKKWRDINA